MSNEKKAVRDRFRTAVFTRDQQRCRVCGCFPTELLQLDSHHITDRREMPNGGYVAENGIALCPDCHKNAEVFHSTGTAHPGFSPEDLYQLIGSSKSQAEAASRKLKGIQPGELWTHAAAMLREQGKDPEGVLSEADNALARFQTRKVKGDTPWPPNRG